MIEIDGSFGEGGGQIVRTAVALSAVTATPVRITRIRQGRSKPGLAAQHARAVTALADICGARVSGAAPGSSEVIFTPGTIRGGRHRVEIGTAGSVTLLMQCLLPALLCADAPSSLHIQGGTDVNWSPAVDYFKNVFLPALSSFGARVSLAVLQRGYYPRGQGEVLLEVACRSTWLPGRQTLLQKCCKRQAFRLRLPGRSRVFHPWEAASLFGPAAKERAVLARGAFPRKTWAEERQRSLSLSLHPLR